MKIRNGFVSNSSSQSFCIYGWDDESLKTDNGESLDYSEIWAIKDKISKLYKDIRLVDSSSPSSDIIFGVGSVNYDIDHGDEDWEDYESPEPSKEEMDKLDKVSEEMKMPKPKMFIATWYNG